MAAVPTNQIANVDFHTATRKRGLAGDNLAVCGQCGAMVAREHTDRHATWHGLTAAAAFPGTPTVTSTIPTDMR